MDELAMGCEFNRREAFKAGSTPKGWGVDGNSDGNWKVECARFDVGTLTL
jgi:hypothetical protein